MIFPNLILSSILQVDDMQRFSAEKSFVTPDEGNILKVELSFDDGVIFIDVFEEDEPTNWFIDYAYDVDGVKTVKLKITTDSGEKEREYNFNVITELEDMLFSNDESLIARESELIELMPKGRNSYKYIHRLAQQKIIRYLDGEGIRFKDNKPFTKEDLFENKYIGEWSFYMALVLIFEDLTIRVDDNYKEKVKTYNGELTDAIKNAVLRLDYNADEEIGDFETKNSQMKFLGR